MIPMVAQFLHQKRGGAWLLSVRVVADTGEAESDNEALNPFKRTALLDSPLRGEIQSSRVSDAVDRGIPILIFFVSNSTADVHPVRLFYLHGLYASFIELVGRVFSCSICAVKQTKSKPPPGETLAFI